MMTQINAVAGDGIQAQGSDQVGLEGQQNVAPANTYDPEKYTLVETEKLSNVGDINNVIHDAKAYQEYQSKGYGLLDEEFGRQNLTPVQILNYLQNPEDGTPATDPPQQVAPEVQQQQIDPNALMSQFEQKMEQKLTQFQQQEQTSQAARNEDSWINKAMDGMGYSGEDNADFRALDLRPRLEARILRKRRSEAIQGDPQREAKINRAFTQAEIAQAASDLAPSLASEKAARDEQLSDKQDGNPQASLGGGPGGRPQKDPKDMDLAEKQQRALDNIEARTGRRPKI